ASLSADSDRMRRFEQEARAAAALNHPNILAVYQLGAAPDGSPYIVSELLEGQTLRERLRAGAIPTRKVMEYALQVTSGLAAAHEKGIVHRDLKPENLFLTRDGHVKILDFGLAKLTIPDRPNSQTLATLGTQPGEVLGTVGYMSPEQVRGQATDPRSDIFSLGAILYEMLSGQRAFQGETGAEVMAAILKQEPAELSVINQNIPPSVERVVWRCLEKDPGERFQSVRDLGFAMAAVSGTSGAVSAAPI